MGPGDNSSPGVYFLIGSGTPGVYTRSGVYLDPALKRSYTVCIYHSYKVNQLPLCTYVYTTATKSTNCHCVRTVRAKKKCPDFLSTYRYFLSASVGTSEGTSVGTYCTVRLKHITHAKKFFTRSEQLYIHNSPAVL